VDCKSVHHSWKRAIHMHGLDDNLINHIALVLDASTSMSPYKEDLIKVADGQIQHLARRSQELDQETRISVWTFADPERIQCVVWDKDVLRLPSIRGFYQPYGNTAFIDATLQTLDHLGETPERHGNHSFLVFVLTDGEENRSVNRPATLKARLAALKDHWTVAALVPNAMGVREAKQFGFPAGNIEIWNANSAAGVDEAGDRVRAATDSYMKSRASGMRSTRNLFSTDATAVNAVTISQAGLKPLAKGSYILVPVPKDCVIKDFTEECGHKYQAGRGFYELMKTETIQSTKDIVVVGRKDSKVYSGRDGRQMIGLPDMDVRVKPDYNPDFKIFVQSMSVNRKLMAGTKYLYLI
jgi:hypothetical protein